MAIIRRMAGVRVHQAVEELIEIGNSSAEG